MHADVVSPKSLAWLRLLDKVSAFLARLGGVAVVSLAVTIIVDVAGRTFFNRPLAPGLNLVTYVWMPALISFGLAYALVREEHIRASLLTASASPRVQRIVEIVSMALTALTAAVIAYFSAVRAIRAMEVNETAVTTAWLALAPWMWVVAVGFAVLALQAVAQLIRAIVDQDFHVQSEAEAALQEAQEFEGKVER